MPSGRLVPFIRKKPTAGPGYPKPGIKLVEINMNLANSKIAQLLIPVADFDKGVAFYRDTLGIPFLFAAPPQMAFFNCGGVRLLVGVMPTGQEAHRGSAIYFQVANIHTVYSSLLDQGVVFKAEPHLVNRTPQSELWLAEFTDPDGNQLALMSDVPLSDA
jgi:methylmalonyl-CoA/ethylmalonyl-CoA epimerase